MQYIDNSSKKLRYFYVAYRYIIQTRNIDILIYRVLRYDTTPDTTLNASASQTPTKKEQSPQTCWMQGCAAPTPSIQPFKYTWKPTHPPPVMSSKSRLWLLPKISKYRHFDKYRNIDTLPENMTPKTRITMKGVVIPKAATHPSRHVEPFLVLVGRGLLR